MWITDIELANCYANYYIYESRQLLMQIYVCILISHVFTSGILHLLQIYEITTRAHRSLPIRVANGFHDFFFTRYLFPFAGNEQWEEIVAPWHCEPFRMTSVWLRFSASNEWESSYRWYARGYQAIGPISLQLYLRRGSEQNFQSSRFSCKHCMCKGSSLQRTITLNNLIWIYTNTYSTCISFLII